MRSTDLFFPIIEGKTTFVSSTAKRQRGLQRGKLGSPLPCFASFCRSKRKAPAASGANYAFAKGSVTPTGDHNLGLIFLLPTFLHRKVGPRRVGVLTKTCKKATANPAPAASGAYYAFAKGFRRRQATTNWPPHKNCPLQKLPPNRVPLFIPPLSRAAAFSPYQV